MSYYDDRLQTGDGCVVAGGKIYCISKTLMVPQAVQKLQTHFILHNMKSSVKGIWLTQLSPVLVTYNMTGSLPVVTPVYTYVFTHGFGVLVP